MPGSHSEKRLIVAKGSVRGPQTQAAPTVKPGAQMRATCVPPDKVVVRKTTMLQQEPPKPDWPQNTIELVKKLCGETYKQQNPPKFKFCRTIQAANHNWDILESYKNLGEAIEAQGNTILQSGSEFRPLNSIRLLLQLHPLWPRLSTSLDKGVDFPLTELSKEKRTEDVAEALKFCNHKGVTKYPKFFEACLDEDVKKGIQSGHST